MLKLQQQVQQGNRFRRRFADCTEGFLARQFSHNAWELSWPYIEIEKATVREVATLLNSHLESANIQTGAGGF